MICIYKLLWTEVSYKSGTPEAWKEALPRFSFTKSVWLHMLSKMSQLSRQTCVDSRDADTSDAISNTEGLALGDWLPVPVLHLLCEIPVH